MSPLDNGIHTLITDTIPSDRDWQLGAFHNFRYIICVIIGQVKRAPHWGVQSRFRVIYVLVCMSTIMQKCLGRIMLPKHAHAQSQFWAVKTDL